MCDPAENSMNAREHRLFLDVEESRVECSRAPSIFGRRNFVAGAMKSVFVTRISMRSLICDCQCDLSDSVFDVILIF